MITLHLNHPKLRSSLVFKYVKPIGYQLTPSLNNSFFAIHPIYESLPTTLAMIPALWSLPFSRERTSAHITDHMCEWLVAMKPVFK